MSFEVYNFENNLSSNIPNIRIGEKSIVLNKVFLNLLNSSKVTVAYDPKIKTIRIKAATENEKGAVQIDKSKIPSGGFLEYFKITQRGRFSAIYDEEQNVFMIKIS
ncbi:MAG: hypothetical protein ABFD08_18675 [Syntrophomonas sp.]